MGTMLATRKFFVPNRTNVKLVNSFLRSVSKAVWLQPCSVAACPKSYYSSKSGRIGCFIKAASLSRRYYSSDPKKESVSEPKNESSSDRNQRLTVDFCEGSRRLERPNRQSLKLLLNDVQPAELQAELKGRILSILEQSDHNEEKAYQATERANEAEVKLELLKTTLVSVRVLVDVRYYAEAMFTKYWILTPQATTWRQDAQNIVQESFETTSSTVQKTPLIPPSKIKILTLYDDTFLKWTYVLVHSMDKYVVSLRNELSTAELVECASDLTYILVTVHGLTHKEIPKSNLGMGPLTGSLIFNTLKNEYKFEEESICNLLRLLNKK